MKTASLFLLLLVISVASSAAVESMGIKNDVAEDSDIGRMLGYERQEVEPQILAWCLQ